VHTDVVPTVSPSLAPTSPPTPSFVEFFIGIPTETVDSYTSAKQSTLQRSLSAVLDVDETEISLFISDADDAINADSETIGTLNGQLRHLRKKRKLGTQSGQLQMTGIAVRVRIESPLDGDDAVASLKDVVAKVDSDDFISHLISTVEVLQSITGPEASIEASKMTYEQNCVETADSLPCLSASEDLGTYEDHSWGTYDAHEALGVEKTEDGGEAVAPASAPMPSDDSYDEVVDGAGSGSYAGDDVDTVASTELRQLRETSTSAKQLGDSVGMQNGVTGMVVLAGFVAVAAVLVAFVGRTSATAQIGDVEMAMQVRDC
jgi:hypothetical protein